MSFKQKIIQALGELLIPILGFYYWSWDLNFIFLFYFLDLIAYLSFTFLKWRKIASFRGELFSSRTFLFFNLIFALSVLTILFIEMAMLFVYPELNLGISFLAFLSYSEWGIPQIVILMPLVVLANYQQYKLFFIATGKFRNLKSIELQKNTLFSLITFLLASVCFLLLVYLGFKNPQFWLWITVIAKASFDVCIYPFWENRQKKTGINSRYH